MLKLNGRLDCGILVVFCMLIEEEELVLLLVKLLPTLGNDVTEFIEGWSPAQFEDWKVVVGGNKVTKFAKLVVAANGFCCINSLVENIKLFPLVNWFNADNCNNKSEVLGFWVGFGGDNRAAKLLWFGGDTMLTLDAWLGLAKGIKEGEELAANASNVFPYIVGGAK